MEQPKRKLITDYETFEVSRRVANWLPAFTQPLSKMRATFKVLDQLIHKKVTDLQKREESHDVVSVPYEILDRNSKICFFQPSSIVFLWVSVNAWSYKVAEAE